MRDAPSDGAKVRKFTKPLLDFREAAAHVYDAVVFELRRALFA